MGWIQETTDALTATVSAQLNTHDGLMVGVAALDEEGTALGTGGPAPGPDYRFEIGSVTKTMTATLLALLETDGVLALEDPVGRWLNVGPHEELTLRQLATHTSGVPSGAPSPYPEKALRQTEIVPGSPWHYANLNYQLIALVLERASKNAYADLLAERIFEPLDMRHSALSATPHAENFSGAGGVESTIEDLAAYTRACLFPPDTALGAALRCSQQPLVDVGPGTWQALAWIVREGGVRDHSGGTPGFCASVSVDPARGRGVAMLANHPGSPAISSWLKKSALLALAGQDPSGALLPVAAPGWEEAALEAARLLLDGQYGQFYGRMAASVRDRVAPEQFERAFTVRTGALGPCAAAEIVGHEVAVNGSVVADLKLPYEAADLTLRLVLLPGGELGGMKFV